MSLLKGVLGSTAVFYKLLNLRGVLEAEAARAEARLPANPEKGLLVSISARHIGVTSKLVTEGHGLSVVHNPCAAVGSSLSNTLAGAFIDSDT